MTSRDFVYWLQGYFEIAKPSTISEEQTVLIQKHLNLVFKHEIDPSMGNAEHQKDLNDIHAEIKKMQQLPPKSGLVRC